jgi:O6-methylguanine-DNA--protein-cysteine methyltransferase
VNAFLRVVILSRHEIATAKMPRSDEAEMWFAAVYKAIQEIPYGKVTSYGHIAMLLGYRKCPTLYRED